MLHKFNYLYYFGQKFVNLTFRLHFRKLVFIGRENIPKDKPYIIAPTHRNSLVDSLVIVYENTEKQVVSLGRADIFKNKRIAKILHFLKILPVYRIRDGKENLGRNQETFDACARILEQNVPICLFPEAVHNPKQKLLPLKKAVARIAFPTEVTTDWQLDTYILPVAYHYTNTNGYLSDLYVTYGKPIRVGNFREEYENAPNRAINLLRNELDTRLRALVVDIPDEDYDEYHALIEANQACSSEAPMPKAQEIISKLNHLKTEQIELYQEKIKNIRDAVAQLKSLNLRPADLACLPKSKWTLPLRAVLLMLLAPFGILGLINAIFPTIIYKRLLRLFTDKQFISSVRIVSGLVFLPLFFLLQSLIILKFSNQSLLFFVYLIVSPLLFILGSYWRKYYKRLINNIKTKRTIKRHRAETEKIEQVLFA